MAKLVKDSVLPMVLQSHRFLVLESLLDRLNSLPQYTIIMLTDIAPSDSLPWFADHFSLFGDGWAFAGSEQEQRDLIKSAIEIHRHKGTPWAIKRTLSLLGYGDCELKERYGFNYHDNSIQHNGKHTYGSNGHWTYYQLIMQKTISLAEAERIKALLLDVAPLRCKLIDIRLANIRHNSTIKHNAEFTYNGVIATWQT